LHSKSSFSEFFSRELKLNFTTEVVGAVHQMKTASPAADCCTLTDIVKSPEPRGIQMVI
jgi:hypothetical protein